MTRNILKAVAMSALVLAAASPAMAAKEKFQRTKPHVNVGTVDLAGKKTSAAPGGQLIILPWGAVAPHDFDDPRVDLPRETFSPRY